MPTSYMLTTNGGLEALVETELRRAVHDLDPPVADDDIKLRPWNSFGRVLLTRHSAADEPLLENLLLALRGVHDVLRHHMMLPLPDASDPPLALYELLRTEATAGDPVPLLRGGSKSFRVSCVREGCHSFTSLDIEREVGGALHELYSAPASMKQFDVRVRVDVAKSVVLIGSSLNRDGPLSRRHKLAFTRSVTLKPNVAYALLQFSGVCELVAAFAGHPVRVLDPCCGSGTIPLEAVEALDSSCGATVVEAVGVDKSLAVVKGAQANAAAAGLSDLCTFVQGNCRSLDRLFPSDHGFVPEPAEASAAGAASRFDAIVTNAPWGVQTAKGSAGKEGEPLLEKIYRGLLHSGHAVLKPGGVMVVLVLRWSLVVDLARRSGLWKVIECLPIRTSNLTPVAVKLERLDNDAVKKQLHERLSELNGFFDFGSSEKPGGKEGGGEEAATPEEAEIEAS